MKLFKLAAASLAATICLNACSSESAKNADSSSDRFVRVQDGKFMIGDSVYNYVGTNFWYGAILASDGRGGDRKRLAAELDTLQAIGIDNLRILVGGDGDDPRSCQIQPTLQTAPGVYNDTILRGLDYLLAELERRGMYAVLYLNNSWEWSGGYGTYLEWAGKGKSVMPNEVSWNDYCDYQKQFVLDDSAKAMSYAHVRNIVGRTNTFTGKPYAESPAIMSWQIANEPRAFSREGKDSLASWLETTARIIKSIDPNHLVSTGSEGKYGCEVDIDLWRRIHSSDAIDYANIHIWPYNWRWISDSTVVSGFDRAAAETLAYIEEHDSALTVSANKPIVLEEFGYPRDEMALQQGSPTTGRDRYYEYVFNIITESGKIQGANFWGWGGLASPEHASWQPGDDYTGDPAQEPQGLNSVFASDTSTVAMIRRVNERMRKKQ